MNDDVVPELYLPASFGSERAIQMAVRVAGDPVSIAPMVLLTIRAADADVGLSSVRPTDDLLDELPSKFRLLVGMMLCFALSRWSSRRSGCTAS